MEDQAKLVEPLLKEFTMSAEEIAARAARRQRFLDSLVDERGQKLAPEALAALG